MHLRSVRTGRVPQRPARRRQAGEQSKVQYHCVMLYVSVRLRRTLLLYGISYGGYHLLAKGRDLPLVVL